MADQNGRLRCMAACWGMGALAGGLSVAVIRVLGNMSWPGAVFIGVLMCAGLALGLTALVCRPLPRMAEVHAAKQKTWPVAAPVVTAVAAAAPALAPALAPAAPVPAPVAAPVAAPVQAERPVAANGKPDFLTAARGGKPDDLKEIKGVGPKLEQLLHSMGVYHFDQIASWRAAEVAWVDDNLEGFKGRVTRDDWVAQAKLLATGGATEFSKRVEDGKVY